MKQLELLEQRKFEDEDIQAGVHTVPYNLIFFPTPILLNLDFLPPKSPFASFPLDILPNSLNIIEKMILLPLFSTIYSSPQPWYSLPLFTIWYKELNTSLYPGGYRVSDGEDGGQRAGPLQLWRVRDGGQVWQTGVVSCPQVWVADPVLAKRYDKSSQTFFLKIIYN